MTFPKNLLDSESFHDPWEPWTLKQRASHRRESVKRVSPCEMQMRNRSGMTACCLDVSRESRRGEQSQLNQTDIYK